MASSAVVSKLIEWLESNGTTDSLLAIRYLGEYEGHGVLAKQTLPCGQVTLQVPFKLTMTVESAARSDLAAVLEKYPQISSDEVLALHVMHERNKGTRSFFAPFLASLPTTFDLPVFWSDTELNELRGTNVLLLTRLMQQQLERDFQTIHQEVTKAFPDIFASLPTLTLEDYTWAMSVIWSRAFGVNRGGKYLRLLCPAMDMFNHDVSLCNPLDDFVSFDDEKQMMVHHVPTEVTNGNAVHISYGQYSNAKLLYSYGFVAQGNPRRAVDFWVKVPPADPYRKLKQTILDANDLTREQTYDFCGTLFRNDVDERLLATLRVILMNEQDMHLYKKAFMLSMISVHNELAVYNNLQNACRRKLETFPTTLEEDEAILTNATEKSSIRLLLAVRVRIEDKQVFAGVIDTIERWKHALATCPETYPPSTTRMSTR
ncbi:unnamed protein product [Hyaloperonospora brassicae]|uniref:Rubisco LSMT substrate-binding domain-containing protein n=1 Tax=Hyaloperonospora brassicae TaxID=162125 RepID=A0AAV0U3P8_HYABA|nr:unnamed protein product [Hyaloperonospora brassicae]